MSDAHTYSSDVAFTPSVKAIQARKGSRDHYGRMEQNGSWATRITPDLARFIEAQTSVFLATANTANFSALNGNCSTVAMNGSTDTVEVDIFSTGGTSIAVQGVPNIRSYFTAKRLSN